MIGHSFSSKSKCKEVFGKIQDMETSPEVLTQINETIFNGARADILNLITMDSLRRFQATASGGLLWNSLTNPGAESIGEEAVLIHVSSCLETNGDRCQSSNETKSSARPRMRSASVPDESRRQRRGAVVQTKPWRSVSGGNLRRRVFPRRTEHKYSESSQLSSSSSTLSSDHFQLARNGQSMSSPSTRLISSHRVSTTMIGSPDNSSRSFSTHSESLKDLRGRDEGNTSSPGRMNIKGMAVPGIDTIREKEYPDDMMDDKNCVVCCCWSPKFSGSIKKRFAIRWRKKKKAA